MYNKISKTKLTRVRALRSGKNRRKYNECIAEGATMVMELAEKFSSDVAFYCVSEGFVDKSPSKLPSENTFLVEDEIFNGISTQVKPDGILAVVSFDIFKNEREGEVAVFLDGMKDPGNLGTIIRTCDWFGVENVLLSEDTVDYTNEKVIQASMGSIWRQPVQYLNYEMLAEKYNDYRWLTADLRGESLPEVKSEKNMKTLIIIGSESHGVRFDHEKMERITIPGSSENQMESLNAATSAAILIAWFSLKE